MALGPELPAAFSTDESVLAALRIRGDEEADPIWPLPLWAGYDDELTSKIADLGNVSAAPFAGSIIGALFIIAGIGRATRVADAAYTDV